MEDCYRHPGTTATSTCVGCSRPICGDCAEDVAGHTICRGCVETTQARLAAETLAPQTPAAPPLRPCGAAQYLRALVFGGIAAVVTAWLWGKFVQLTGFQIGLIAVLLGIAVGVAVKVGAEGRSGRLLPWMGALLAGFAVVLGRAFIVQGVVQGNPEMAGRLQELPQFLHFVLYIVFSVRTMDVMDWVFVAIAMWEGWTIPRKSTAP